MDRDLANGHEDERAAFALFVPAFFACLSGFLFGLRWCTNIRLATLPSSAPPPPAPAQLPIAPSPITTPVDQSEAEGEAETVQPAPTPTRTWRERITNEMSPMWLVLFYGGLSSVAVFFIYFGFAVCSLLFVRKEKLMLR